MKHHHLLLALLLSLLTPALHAQTAAAPAPGAASEMLDTMLLPGKTMAEGITEITGVAISPLLGMSVVGAWTYYKAEESMRDRLPWYCHPYVWGTGLVLIAVCFLKDFLGAAAPALVKKPLDFAELFEDKLSALVASAAFVPLVTLAMSKLPRLPEQTLAGAADSGLAMAPALGWLDWGAHTPWVSIPVAILAFLVVWLSSHAIHVLIALSPFGIVDSGLKLFKLGLLALVTGSALLHPWFGLAVSLLVIAVALLVAGWSFRLTIFGTLMGRDFLLNKRAAKEDAEAGVKGFLQRRHAGVPARTYGRLERTAENTASFVFRPWLVLPERRVEIPATGRVLCKGLLHPGIAHLEEEKRRGTLILLPRYRGVEEHIAARYGCQEVVDSALLRGFKAVRHWLVEMLALGRREPAAA